MFRAGRFRVFSVISLTAALALKCNDKTETTSHRYVRSYALCRTKIICIPSVHQPDFRAGFHPQLPRFRNNNRRSISGNTKYKSPGLCPRRPKMFQVEFIWLYRFRLEAWTLQFRYWEYVQSIIDEVVTGHPHLRLAVQRHHPDRLPVSKHKSRWITCLRKSFVCSFLHDHEV